MQSCAPPPSHTGEEVGVIAGVAGVVIGTIAVVEVHKENHTIKGCVTASPSGLQLRDQHNSQTYTLLGATASTKVGDIVQLRGTKEKTAKGSTADPSFVVERLYRSYGPCPLDAAPGAGTTAPAQTPKAE
jgi:hypothetical protein